MTRSVPARIGFALVLLAGAVALAGTAEADPRVAPARHPALARGVVLSSESPGGEALLAATAGRTDDTRVASGRLAVGVLGAATVVAAIALWGSGASRTRPAHAWSVASDTRRRAPPGLRSA